MPNFFRTLSLLGWAFCLSAGAQQYQQGNKGFDATWKPGSWRGTHQLPNVYCVQFPLPDTALSLAQRTYNENAIHLVRVEYAGKIMANIVTSAIPAGTTAAQEMARLLDAERMAEQRYGHAYNITEFATDFGPTIGLRIKDAAAAGSDAPFPLVRLIYQSAKQPIHSLSVHRLFARGSHRFEIAVYQLASPNTGANSEAAMTERLTGLADAMVNSFQTCTAQLPARAAQ